MYCNKCGNSVMANDSFCPKCGKSLKEASHPQPLSVRTDTISKPLPQFSSLRGLSSAVVITFGLLLLVTIGAIISDIFQIELLNRIAVGSFVTPAEAEANDNRQALFGRLYFLVNIIVIILFLTWISNAHRNLRSLGAEGLRWSPGWAVGGFFIPFASLAIPYMATKEIWKASAPDHQQFKMEGWKHLSPTPALGWWWGLFIFAGFWGQALLRGYAGAETIGELQDYAVTVLISDIVLVPAIILAMFMVWSINRRQEQRFEAMRFATKNP